VLAAIALVPIAVTSPATVAIRNSFFRTAQPPIENRIQRDAIGYERFRRLKLRSVD
jgi:hypothetical protein